MSKEPNNIDRLVREKLDGFEMTPPPSVWENTSASLQTGRKKRFFLWFALGIAALAILGTGIYFFSSNTTSNERVLTANTDSQSSQSNKNDSEGDVIGSSTDKEGTTNSTTERDTNSQNSADSETSFFSEDLTGKRDFSNVNLNLTREKINTQKKENALKDKSQKENSLKNSGYTDTSEGNKNTNGQDSDLGESKTEKSNSLSGNDSFGDTKLNPSLTLKSGNDDRAKNANDNSKRTVEYSALPIYDLGPLNGFKAKPTLIDFNQGSISNIAPKRQLFSLEGSIGMSTFNNKPDEKTTDPQLFSILNSAASNRQSFDVRLGINYHLTNRVSFQTGVHYNSSSEDYAFNSEEITTYSYDDTISFSVDSVTMDTTFNINTVYYDSTTIAANTERNTYKLFSLPFQFAWSQPISARSSLEFALGGELSLFGKNSGTTILDESTTLPASSSLHTSGMLSIGGSIKYLYHFGDRHAVYVEPWAQFGVTNQHTPQLNYTSLRRRVGIRFGYRFYL